MRYNGRILDVSDRSIVASVNGTYLHTEWAKKALEKARKAENPKEGRILHSGPFTSWEFVSYCKEKKGIQSMRKEGCPYENAPMERLDNPFKHERIYPNHFYTQWELDEALSSYVFVWYNHIRPIRIMADTLRLKHELKDNFSNQMLQKCLTTTICTFRFLFSMSIPLSLTRRLQAVFLPAL